MGSQAALMACSIITFFSRAYAPVQVFFNPYNSTVTSNPLKPDIIDPGILTSIGLDPLNFPDNKLKQFSLLLSVYDGMFNSN